ncbi:aquaporin [Streptomyces sp. NPDC056361]|uniref:aquaporin n=1 Tax=Streptomyces sp. NPDC056361 TaxID=3345795 RepID=UPI0035D8FE53
MSTPASLVRRTTVEALGTAAVVALAAVVAVVVGSGIQATELTQDVGTQSLTDSLATVFGLGVLIALRGPVSGAHFNPAVTLAAWFTGRRTGEAPTLRDVAAGLGLVSVCFGRPAAAGENKVPVPDGRQHPAAATHSTEETAPAR